MSGANSSKRLDWVPRFADLVENGDGRTALVSEVQGTDVHYKFLYKPRAKKLLVIFHGACDRQKRKFPAFNVFFPADIEAHQINIFDSSLLTEGNFQLGWYAGTKTDALQPKLVEFFRGVTAQLDAQNVIFMGTSGGGFAALFNSWHFPESLAVIANPQTNILRYYSISVINYLDSCWPSIDLEADKTAGFCMNLSEIYGSGFSNNIIYLQSNADYFHYTNHMKPFFQSLRSEDMKRVSLFCNYWGVVGHSNSVPYRAIENYIRAGLAVDDFDKEGMIKAHFEISKPDTFQESASQKAKSSTVDEHDLRMASALRDYHLRKELGGLT